MDLIGEERGRLARVASWFDASPTEITGLAVLLVCALAATGALVWAALGRPDLPGADIADVAGSADAAANAVGQDPSGHGPDGTPDGQRPSHVPPHEHDHSHGHADDQLLGGEAGPGGEAAHPGGVAGPGLAAEVTVHVAGAVASPGVVVLDGGARVDDAIGAAGGLLEDADTTRINLARPLVDGEQLLVLRVGEEPPAGSVPGASSDGSAGTGGAGQPDAGAATGGGGSGGGAGGAQGGPVDLNLASEQELQSLPGIGPSIAARIVQHRERHGPFRQPGDLRDVSGIGEKRFQDLADLITVG